jgi:invasion protein IalB
MRARTVPLREALVAIFATAAAFDAPPAAHGQDSGRGQNASRLRGGGEPAVTASPWTKFCAKDEDAAATTPVCMTFSESRLANGQSARVTLIEREGQQRRIMRVVLPGDMNLALGARAVVDQGKAFTAASFRCQPSACTAEFNVTADMLARLEGGRQLLLQSVTPGGQPVRFPVPLADFASVHAGPPNDQKAIEELQQKKLQDELHRRAEDMRKNLKQPPDKLQEELERRADELRRRMERFPVQLPDAVR